MVNIRKFRNMNLTLEKSIIRIIKFSSIELQNCIYHFRMMLYFVNGISLFQILSSKQELIKKEVDNEDTCYLWPSLCFEYC